MVNYKYFTITALAVALGFSACKPSYESPEFSKGDIDPTRFVMIGGIHTSGYMDDALYREGQENSLPALIAQQLSLVGGGPFYQPLVAEGSVGISLNGLSRMMLGYKTDCKGVTSLSPVRVAANGDASIFSDNTYNPSALFGNYGVPGLLMAYVSSPGLYATNNFYKRMASSPSGGSVLGDALATNPTFFSLFLGVDEVLKYAKSGAKDSTLLTAQEFEVLYAPVVNQMVANGAKGVLATIPDVSKMPYFTTIPYNGLSLDASNATTLNSVYNPLGFSFQVGANPFMMIDPNANSFAVRQMLPGECLLLSVPLDSVKCNQMGVLFPLRNEFVLTNAELDFMRTRIQEYNTVIRSLAAQHNLAVVDVDAFVTNLSDGFVYNGISMSAKFVSGGAYSLDGVQFNPRGNALLANKFIQAINKQYHARIPELNAGKYNATLFP